MFAVVSTVQPEKVAFNMVTELEMVTAVSPEQYANAEDPMEVTELGMVTVVRLVQL